MYSALAGVAFGVAVSVIVSPTFTLALFVAVRVTDVTPSSFFPPASVTQAVKPKRTPAVKAKNKDLNKSLINRFSV